MFVRVTRKVLSFGVDNSTGINVTNRIAIICNCGKGLGSVGGGGGREKKKKEELWMIFFLHTMVVYILRLLLEQKPYFTLISLNMLFIALGSRNEQ